MFKAILSVLLPAIVSAEFTALSYSADLKCGGCVKSGYNFCFVGVDGQQFDNETVVEATCCQDTTCSQMTNSSWSCSSSYNDTDLALTFCPQKKNKCGDQWKYDFSNNKNVSTDIEIKNLTKGETCSIKIKSDCGAPAFKLADNQTNATDSNVYISYVEYNEKHMNKSEYESSDKKGGYDKNSTDRNDMKPDDERPPRNSNYTDSGNEGDKSEQKAPKRKYDNGTEESSEKVDDRKQKKEDYYKSKTKNGTETKSEKEKEEYRKESTNDTKTNATNGYGEPTKGEYKPSKGEYKTFGTEGQGNSSLGVKDDANESCEERVMWVTVTAKEDMAATYDSSSDTLDTSSELVLPLTVGNYDFVDDVVSSYTVPVESSNAMMLMSTIGAGIAALAVTAL